MIETNPNYWDCNCESNYIHPACQTYCPICGSKKDEMPDARQDEIDARLNFAKREDLEYDRIKTMPILREQ